MHSRRVRLSTGSHFALCFAGAISIAVSRPTPLLAAPATDAVALFEHGKANEEGKGMPKDAFKAFAAYSQAAEAGHPPAMARLAEMYLYGIGTRQDDRQAAEWALKAAEAGVPGAMVILGWMHEAGRGVAKDAGRAAALYRKAADLGDTTGMRNVGVCYEQGTGVPKDAAEAVKWYRRSAEGGSDGGMYGLAMMYLRGDVTPEDPVEAARWFRQAAAKGNADAATAATFCLIDEKPAPIAPADAAVVDRLLPVGLAVVRGFNDVKLGATYKDVLKQCGELYFAKDARGWVKDEGDQYFVFSRGRLFAYQKTYRDDNDGWIDKLKVVLGPAQGEDKLFKSAKPWEQGRTENLAVWYDFQDSVVKLDAFWNHQRFRTQQAVTAAVFDRAWLRDVLAQELTRKRAVMGWAARAVADVDAGKDLGKLDPLPGTIAVHEATFSAFLAAESGGDTPGQRPRIWVRLAKAQPGRPMAVVRRATKGGTELFDPVKGQSVIATREGMVGVSVDLDPPADMQANLTLVLVPLRTRMNVELVKELLANSEGEYFRATYEAALYPAYYWRFGKGWSIRVGNDNMMSLMKSPEAAKRL